MPEGGPCAHCASDSSTAWYGGRNNPQYCRKNACMRAGGYRKPLSDAASSSGGSSRKRRRQQEDAQAAEQPQVDSDVEDIDSHRKFETKGLSLIHI